MGGIGSTIAATARAKMCDHPSIELWTGLATEMTRDVCSATGEMTVAETTGIDGIVHDVRSRGTGRDVCSATATGEEKLAKGETAREIVTGPSLDLARASSAASAASDIALCQAAGRPACRRGPGQTGTFEGEAGRWAAQPRPVAAPLGD